MKKILISIAAALVLPVGTVNALPTPDLQEGLWSIHTQSVTNLGYKTDDSTYSLCRNHAYDKEAESIVKNMKGCTTVSESSVGGTFFSEMHCTVGNSVITTKGTGTVSNTSSHSESHATYVPAMYGMSEVAVIQDQKYVGSCPAGMKPGDTMKPNGTMVHR